MEKINIFGDEPASTSKDASFSINKSYASRYNNWRRAEEIQKLKDIYGDVDYDSDESTSESEDEDAKELTANVEKGWLKAFSALKAKDPKIYQHNAKFYMSDDESDDNKTHKRKKKDKPIYLKEYETKLALENGGEEISGKKKKASDKMLKGSQYEKDNEELRKSIVSAMQSDSDEGDGDDLLVPRKKTTEEEATEDTDYIEWLKGEEDDTGKAKKGRKDLEPLQKYWNDPKLNEAEKYLKDFILNKRYIDKDANRIPTYDEVVDSDDESSDEEEEEVEKQEMFERTYNFRFEEPGAEIIKTFPGVIEDSVRRKDTRRSEKRAKKRDRQHEEKDRRKEELMMLKKMKRQEIEKKINCLRDITGNKAVGFCPADLEEDFDPKAHDKMMQQYFTEDYYDGGEEEKPNFDCDDEDLAPEDWDKWKGGDVNVEVGDKIEDTELNEEQEVGNYGQDGEEVNFNMDADYDPSLNLLPKKRKRKRSKFAEVLAAHKPTFNPDKKTFDKYLDEYYKLDYEDMIGDIPCRFKYRTVMANDFGLTTGEVLSCPARELNAWVSLKKMSQYRTQNAEKKDKLRYRKKARDHQKKLQFLPSLVESPEEEKSGKDVDKTLVEKKGKSPKSKKEEKHIKDDSSIEENQKTIKKRKRGQNAKKEECRDDNSDIEENTADIKPEKSDIKQEKSDKKLKKKRKKSKVLQTEEKNDCDVKTEETKHEDLERKDKVKKRKRKHLCPGSVVEKSDGPVSKKQKKKSSGGFKSPTLGLSDERLRAYGLDPRKARFMNIDPLGPKFKT